MCLDVPLSFNLFVFMNLPDPSAATMSFLTENAPFTYSLVNAMAIHLVENKSTYVQSVGNISDLVDNLGCIRNRLSNWRRRVEFWWACSSFAGLDSGCPRFSM